MAAAPLPTIHATAVLLDGAGVLLVGPSGSGKSDLALRLIDRGALLIADDRVAVDALGGELLLSAPPTIAGLLEVRGVGIVRLAHSRQPVPARLLVDLSGPGARLPEPETRAIAGVALPLLRLAAFDASAPVKLAWALAAPRIPG